MNKLVTQRLSGKMIFLHLDLHRVTSKFQCTDRWLGRGSILFRVHIELNQVNQLDRNYNYHLIERNQCLRSQKQQQYCFHLNQYRHYRQSYILLSRHDRTTQFRHSVLDTYWLLNQSKRIVSPGTMENFRLKIDTFKSKDPGTSHEQLQRNTEYRWQIQNGILQYRTQPADGDLENLIQRNNRRSVDRSYLQKRGLWFNQELRFNQQLCQDRIPL